MDKHAKTIKKDLDRLIELYVQFKELDGEFQALGQKYKIPELERLLADDRKILDKLDHDFIKMAWAIKKGYPDGVIPRKLKVR